MENFSKFFDSIVSGKTSTNNGSNFPQPINNDTINIDIDNNIYNKPFPIEDYYLISNEIILGSIKLYKNLYGENSTPFPFIGFYFIEFCKYSDLHSYYLNKFLILFHNKNNNLANAINIFSRFYKNSSEIRFIKKSSIFNSLQQGYYLEASKDLYKKIITYSNSIDVNLKNAIEETKNTINTINNTLSSSNLKARYIEYISEENINSTSTKVNLSKKQNTQNKTTIKKRIITPPKQEPQEKVSSINLPKLSTGRIYPTSFTHSRIDSAHFAWRFLESDRIYKLIKRYKFTKIKYTNGFEDKRKALFETKKSSFDLF